MEINNIGNYQLSGSVEKNETKDSNGNSSFSQLLRDSLQEVNRHQQNANQASQNLALGKAESVHDVMLAAKKAETTLSLATEVQNKAVSAYEEIMRLQV